MWSCTDNQTCLHQSLVCDGIVHCRDSSDEDPSKCSECPLPFGHKSGSGDANLPCLHRFSGRPICAVPCDGIDDLCQDLLDEQCSNRVDFIVAIAVVLVGAIVLVTVLIERGETTGRKKKVESSELPKENSPKYDGSSSPALLAAKFLQAKSVKREVSSVKRLVARHPQAIKSTLLFLGNHPDLQEAVCKSKCLHGFLLDSLGNSQAELLVWLKNNVGTNSITQRFLDLAEEGLVVKIKLRILPLMTFFSLKVELALLVVRSVMKIFLYYFDFVKDAYILVFLASDGGASDFDSFSTQVVLVSVLLLLLFAVSSAATAASFTKLFSKPKKRFLSTALSLFLPSQAIVKNVLIKWRQQRIAEKFMVEDEARMEIQKMRIRRMEELEAERMEWKRLWTKLRNVENVLENFPQLVFVLLLSALSTSGTKAVLGRQTSVAVDRNLGLILLSAFLSFKQEFAFCFFSVPVMSTRSLRTLIMGTVRGQVMERDGFVPMPGKVLYGLLAASSLSARSFALLLYFTPSLGLFDCLHHFQMGSIPFHPLVAGEPWDITRTEDGKELEATFIKDAWCALAYHNCICLFKLLSFYRVPVKDPVDLTVLSLSQVYMALPFILAAFLALNATFMVAISRKFREVRKKRKKVIFLKTVILFCSGPLDPSALPRGFPGPPSRALLRLGSHCQVKKEALAVRVGGGGESGNLMPAKLRPLRARLHSSLQVKTWVIFLALTY